MIFYSRPDTHLTLSHPALKAAIGINQRILKGLAASVA